MGKMPIPKATVHKIIKLRKTGHSLPEIKLIVGHSGATVFKYTRGIKVLSKFRDSWRGKWGGSSRRSLRRWEDSRKMAEQLMILPLKKRDLLLILACLYWGEGTKKELNLINSDPKLISTFVFCLQTLGIQRKDLKITVRIYEDINRSQAIRYWADVLNISKNKIMGVNILGGKKKGKLPYGMCRVRVKKSAVHFKLIMSMIELISKECRRSSMDRTRDS